MEPLRQISSCTCPNNSVCALSPYPPALSAGTLGREQQGQASRAGAGPQCYCRAPMRKQDIDTRQLQVTKIIPPSLPKKKFPRIQKEAVFP